MFNPIIVKQQFVHFLPRHMHLTSDSQKHWLTWRWHNLRWKDEQVVIISEIWRVIIWRGRSLRERFPFIEWQWYILFILLFAPVLSLKAKANVRIHLHVLEETVNEENTVGLCYAPGVHRVPCPKWLRNHKQTINYHPNNERWKRFLWPRHAVMHTFQVLGCIRFEIVRTAHNQIIDTTPSACTHHKHTNYGAPTNDPHQGHLLHNLQSQTCLNVKLIRGFWYFLSFGTACFHFS